MHDAPWQQLLDIHPQSITMLLVFVVFIGVQEFLVQQKKYPLLAAIVMFKLPFLMMIVLYYFLYAAYRCNTDIIWYLRWLACLPLGLIYGARCVRMDSSLFLWVGRIFSFIYAGLILTLFLTYLLTVLSYGFPGITIPGYLPVAIYMIAAALLILVLRRLELPARRRQRFKDCQCIHCGYSLERNMLSTHCPECGGEIEPQVSQLKSKPSATQEKSTA